MGKAEGRHRGHRRDTGETQGKPERRHTRYTCSSPPQSASPSSSTRRTICRHWAPLYTGALTYRVAYKTQVTQECHIQDKSDAGVA